MRSIRVFLIVATLATLILVMFVAAVQGYKDSMAEAESLFDSQLQELAQITVQLPSDNGTTPSDQPSHIAFQLWRVQSDGLPALAKRSANAPSVRLSDLSPGFDYANFQGYRWRTYTHYSGHSGLIAIVAARSDIRFQLADNIILDAILPMVIGLPLSGLLVWLLVGRGLWPLKELAERLKEKEFRDLSPVELPAHPVELDQVLNSVNALLKRLSDAFKREQRFASDAAHELRTPISALKLQIHNLRERYPDQNAELAPLDDGIRRMQHLVEQILALYRSTPEQVAQRFTSVNLYDLAAEVIADLYPAIERRHQEIELTGVREETLIKGDRFSLATLLQNLIANAHNYTQQGGHIDVSLERRSDGLVLRVEDDGPGIPDGEKALVFERFHRIGGDRHDSGQSGCGLGLAIVRNIVELHGASVTVSDGDQGKGTCFTISFPPSALWFRSTVSRNNDQGKASQPP